MTASTAACAIGFAWRRMTVPRTGCTRSAPCKPSRTASTGYSSDEDECTSDQDDRGPAYESDDDDGYDRSASQTTTSMRSCAAL